MNASSQLERQAFYGTFFARSSMPAQQSSILNTETIGYSTIDGGVITLTDGAHAVSNGSGIFIGDYFVGLTDNNNLIGSGPAIIY